MAKPVMSHSLRTRRTFSLAGLLARGHQPTSTGKSAPKGRSRPCRPLHRNYSKVAKRHLSMPKKRATRAHSKTHARFIRHVIVQDFKTSMEDTRQRIAEEVAGTLAVAEQDAMVSIDDASSAYGKKLDRFQTTRRALLESFQPTSRQSKGAQPNSHSFTDRLSILRDTLSRKQTALDVHWKEWVNVQQKIFYLGIEMLGPEAMSDSRYPGISKRKIHTAASAFKKQLTVEEGMQEARKKQRRDVEDLATDTRRQLAAQEKTWLSGKKNRRDQMLQLAKQMMACV